MKITHLQTEYIAEAAGLFVERFRHLRRAVPALPARMEDPGCVSERLENLLANSAALAAFEGSRLVGYLGWWLLDGFRDTDRKAAYCPVIGHAAADGMQPQVYRALYRAAADDWLKAGCQAHAITVLANDEAAQKAWFWNGFGLTVIDAVRTLDPLGILAPEGYIFRKAVTADAEALADIEAEHWKHYAEPPTLMVTYSPNTASEFSELIKTAENSVWTAWKGSDLAGYLRFESASHGATEIVSDSGTAACTGAYVRPRHRGQRIAAVLLDAALADYRAHGYQRCSVDFESFNPEAASFWPKYFTPVCLSMIRVPERSL